MSWAKCEPQNVQLYKFVRCALGRVEMGLVLGSGFLDWIYAIHSGLCVFRSVLSVMILSVLTIEQFQFHLSLTLSILYSVLYHDPCVCVCEGSRHRGR